MGMWERMLTLTKEFILGLDMGTEKEGCRVLELGEVHELVVGGGIRGSRDWRTGCFPIDQVMTRR